MFGLSSTLFAFLSILILSVLATDKWTFEKHVPLPTSLDIKNMGVVRLDSSNHPVFVKVDSHLVDALYLVDNSVRFLTNNQELPFLWLVVADQNTVPSSFEWINNGWTTPIPIEDDKGKEQDPLHVALVLGWRDQMGQYLPGPASYGKDESQVYCKIEPAKTMRYDIPSWIAPLCGSFLQHTT